MFFDLKKGLFIDDNKNNNKILAINWNITGLCLNKCTYCYGSDIFNYRTLDTSEFLSLIKTIRMIHPDLLVISGGEPLLCSDLELIIKEIKKAKINMIVDTSGVISLDKYIELLQQAKVHVRISIDSSQHEENERIRRSTVPNSTSIVKNNISLLISKKIPLTVQTTITHMNIDHLSELGYYLSSEGVENWRLSVVIPHDTLLTDNALNIYNKLNSLFPEINIRISNIDLKQTKHIVLIDPKGDLILRGNVNNNKEKVCCLLSEQMSKDDILNLIDHSDHMNRYMYLPANKFIHLR